ncbi:MAG: APC family permease [Isosphaerales bacterium]
MTEFDSNDRRSATLPRVLGPVDAFCVVVGCTIGSGIFLVPATVAKNVPFMSGIVLVWVIGGLFSLAGALTLAELGAMLPKAGGLYVFLRVAYGALPAFLFGWAEFLVVRSGSMATLAAAFARYFAELCPHPAAVRDEVWQAGAAVLAISVVTAVNILGTRRGGTLQVFGTALKVGGVVVLIALPFLLGGGTVANFSPVWPSAAGSSIFTGMMFAMVGVLWAYDGWTNVTPLGEEIRDPGRNIPRSLLLGMAVLIAVYVAMTLAYHYVLPMERVASAIPEPGHVEQGVAALYCRQLLGWKGVVGISILVMCSTFISLNGNALTGPRAYFAMARDGLFPRGLCRVHKTFQTPANAILVQGVWAIILTVAGTVLIVVPPPAAGHGWTGPFLAAWKGLNETPLYDLLFTYVIFGANLFYMLAISSVFVLRVRLPDLQRPYRTLGYPLTPLLYVAGALILLGSMLLDHKSRLQSLAGLGIILLGLPAYLIFRRNSPTRDSERSSP